VKPSNNLVLITKKVRMEWTDVMALDAELSATAFKVAGVIGTHFNNCSGDTYVTQQTIARVMRLSPRTVQNAIVELERRGYLIVRRRELGTRSDGRRVCGGRGVANTYVPAFERAQVAATNAGRKLAARCVRSWEQKTQNAARKHATGCLPTLKDNSFNSLMSHSLGAEGDLLLARLGREVFHSWFRDVGVKGIADDTLTLSAPTRFVQNWIKNHFTDAVFACWQKAQPAIKRVEVVSRS
jgi:DNA-binding Lrp family transcriptional regulator